MMLLTEMLFHSVNQKKAILLHFTGPVTETGNAFPVVLVAWKPTCQQKSRRTYLLWRTVCNLRLLSWSLPKQLLLQWSWSLPEQLLHSLCFFYFFSVDAFATTMDMIHHRLNPAESLIFILNPTPLQRNCATIQTPMGLKLPCKSEWIKILGASSGNQHCKEEQFKIFATKIEDALSPTAIPIRTPADKIVDILHQQQATLLPWNSIN